MPDKPRSSRYALLGATALTAALSMFAAAPASAESPAYQFSQPAQPLASALRSYSATADQEIIFADRLVAGRNAPELKGAYTAEGALMALLDGTGLTVSRTATGVLLVQRAAADPQSGSAAGGGAEVEALIVTAQKREEDIQDVPIAISAFSQEQLERSQVAGGPDLMTQVPNMTFTKTNFSGYSIQIRGIGTQAISATTDAAVAVAFNNTPFIRNRFFEQEFYDLQRIEVLRGPQGTLYGRNATAGVVNLISQKPKFLYEAKASADIANYNSTRLEGMVNIPLVEDVVAIRLAGAWTKREGYATNELTGNPIDGRDLWSTRASLRFTPTDRLDVNLIWEHFEEDDDRLRSGKQLCATHVVTEVAGITTAGNSGQVPLSENPGLPDRGFGSSELSGAQSTFSQGCAPASLYSDESFQKVNGFALPYYVPLSVASLPVALDNPYESLAQSHDLRVIEAGWEPQYRAKTDLAELQISYDLTDGLTLTSETGYSVDTVFSTQDYNRFATAAGAWEQSLTPGQNFYRPGVLTPGPNGGIFCDPQLGCSDRLVAADLSTAEARQFSQELRLSSDFDGAFNFSLGANFLRSDSIDKYYVFINSLSLLSAIGYSEVNFSEFPYVGGVTDNRECLRGRPEPQYGEVQLILSCTYMDPNPIGALNDLGHNYFLSKNPYKLISYAMFGEAYYNFTDNLKLTGGLRFTVDKKEAPLIPSWTLASNTIGYPVAEVVEQEWREPTGRLTIDWKPQLIFTDETLVYASYAHGYKAGGANPPPYGVAIYFGDGVISGEIKERTAARPKTFDPEFVNAYEIGAKNTLLDGRMTLNVGAFYYDYTGYQISQIVDRSAANMNFDSEVWGAELEADWRPRENLKLGLKLGYEKTRVADGEQAIDIMDRTAGDPRWVLVRPFPSIPSNCIMPEWLYLGNIVPSGGIGNPQNPELVNLGGPSGGTAGGCELTWLLGQDPGINGAGKGFGGGGSLPVINYTAYSTNPEDFPGWMGGDLITDRTYPGVDVEEIARLSNNGEGIFKELGGNELPNAPHFTATITADYTIPLPNDWLATLHTDLYYQSEAWTRIFNTEGYDKLKAYSNINLAAIFTNEDAGWKVMAYVKNVLDRDSITGAFLNSDDTGLTTNVFLTEPRLFGLRVTKEWNGGPLFGTFGSRHEGAYPLTIELGGQIQRHDAPKDVIAPAFTDAFTTVDPLQGQSPDLDIGDGREITMTYRPAPSWSISIGARFGKTNGRGNSSATVDESEADEACLLGQYYCDLYPEYYTFGNFNDVEPTNWSSTSIWDKEQHAIVDFSVGRDIGMGLFQQSQLSAGLRFARLSSTAQSRIEGQPDWDFPAEYAAFLPSQTHVYESDVHAERKFEGAGPVVSWAASQPLIGSEQSGTLGLDWTVSGGVLFGKQKTTYEENLEDQYFNQGYFLPSSTALVVGRPRTPNEVTNTRTVITRSESVKVPTGSISLGLSYNVDRFSIGAGYRWERYFDALDVGYDEAKDEDRTIDGPYFKIAVGFGG
jgi:outer membrane receptor protein involved in Fe transport